MNRIGKYASLLICSLVLAGCGDAELPNYRLSSEEAQVWQVETGAATEMEREPMIVEADLGSGGGHGTRQNDQAALNTEIIGVSLAEDSTLDLDQNAMSEAEKNEVAKARAKEALGREKVSADAPKSVLYFEANREYLIEVRALVRIDEDTTEQDELALDLSFPQTMTVDEFSTIACTADTPQYYHEAGYTVTTSLYDLKLEYIQNSFALSKDGDLASRYIDDQLLLLEDSEGMVHLCFDTTLPDITAAVKEYVVSYRVRTSLSDGQEAELELRENNPIRLEPTGIVAGKELCKSVSGNDIDEPETLSADSTEDTSLAALEWCLRDDYSGSETITTEVDDRIYITAKVILPDWAAEHAAKNGLAIEWGSTMVKAGSYLREVRLRLKSCPANYGGDAIVYEVTLDAVDRGHLMLSSIVADPATFWQKIDQGERGVSYQPITIQSQQMRYDLTTDADGVMHQVTQLSLEGETASLLGNEFYVVCEVAVRQAEQD